tara:strand:+ start:381 stop:1601 length:1221 start_codon:yes stop_codon:yes gene_type:complete
MKNYQIINSCEVCGNNQLESVLDLGSHTLCDNLQKLGDNSEAEKYPIKVLFCKKCCTAHQSCQVDKNLLFPSTYHYRARFTKDVINGLNDLANSVENILGSVSNKVVLDIGCNDGTLLDIFSSKGALTYGIEPTDAYKDATGKKHTIYNNYFDKEIVSKLIKNNIKPDIITFTNVFAHIEDLKNLLDNLKKIMHSKTVVCIENHYLGSILSKNQFDTFYHEHPRTYSLTSFEFISSYLESKIINAKFPKRYGGNIRVMMVPNKYLKNFKQQTNLKELKRDEEDFYYKFKSLNKFFNSWKISKRKEILDLVSKHGPIPAKAFPGRAAILIELLKLSRHEIECVYEKPGSKKIGHYVPSTKIPIVSSKELFELEKKPEVILNLAWHIPDEIKDFLLQNDVNSKIINII